MRAAYFVAVVGLSWCLNLPAQEASIAPAPVVADVLKLHRAKVDPGVIVAFVRNSPRVNLSADEIVNLRSEGVSSEILVALLSPREAAATVMESAAAPAPEPAELAPQKTTPEPTVAGPSSAAASAVSTPVLAETPITEAVSLASPTYVEVVGGYYPYRSYAWDGWYVGIGVGWGWGCWGWYSYPWYSYSCYPWYGYYCYSPCDDRPKHGKDYHNGGKSQSSQHYGNKPPGGSRPTQGDFKGGGGGRPPAVSPSPSGGNRPAPPGGTGSSSPTLARSPNSGVATAAVPSRAVPGQRSPVTATASPGSQNRFPLSAPIAASAPRAPVASSAPSAPSANRSAPARTVGGTMPRRPVPTSTWSGANRPGSVPATSVGRSAPVRVSAPASVNRPAAPTGTVANTPYRPAVNRPAAGSVPVVRSAPAASYGAAFSGSRGYPGYGSGMPNRSAAFSGGGYTTSRSFSGGAAVSGFSPGRTYSVGGGFSRGFSGGGGVGGVSGGGRSFSGGGHGGRR